MAKFLFVVQGEGRGHLTQAISLQAILQNAGHQVVAVLVGKSTREIPSFFQEKIKAPIHYFESPNFVKDKQNKSILLSKTILFNLKKSPDFIKNLKILNQYYTDYQPDVIINFYDLLAGIYNMLYKSKIPMVVVGHQYFLELPGFEFPENRKLERLLLKINSSLTSWGAKLKLALSFAPYLKNYGNTVVVPPLLREEVLKLTPEKQDFILVYVNNDGYAEDIIAWHKKNPETKLECFWDRKGAAEMEEFTQNLIFHKINDVKFLEKMRTCKAFVSTAGFESVCEAMALTKPVMMRPVDGQFEQMCNAMDAQKAGAGIYSEDFNITKLIDYIQHNPKIDNTNSWFLQTATIVVNQLEKLIFVK
ncbi:MAG: glycosyltransferase family protein [Thermonemataceae bacterium]|nr:glycosyltransferase family protein [Thermonemataceae bacterium]